MRLRRKGTHMSQHIFESTHAVGKVEVIVGFDPRLLDYFVQIYKAGSQAPFESRDGMKSAARVEKYLRGNGITPPSKVIDILENEPVEVDRYPLHDVGRRVQFHSGSPKAGRA